MYRTPILRGRAPRRQPTLRSYKEYASMDVDLPIDIDYIYCRSFDCGLYNDYKK